MRGIAVHICKKRSEKRRLTSRSKFLHLSQNTRFHNQGHMNPPMGPTIGQIKPLHKLILYPHRGHILSHHTIRHFLSGYYHIKCTGLNSMPPHTRW